MQSRKEGSQGQVTSPHTPQCPWGNQRTLFPQSERVWSKAALCSGEGAPGWVVKGWVVEVFISLGSCQDRGPGLVLFQWLAGLHWGPRQSRRLHQLKEACSLLPGGKAGEEAGTMEVWLVQKPLWRARERKSSEWTLLAPGGNYSPWKTSITGATALCVQIWVFLKIGFL